MENPYVFGRPIRNPENFYGREDEIREIFSNIKKMQPISLIGQRKIGCTSLLHYISHPEISSKYLGPDNYIILYIDLEGLINLSQEQFWVYVTEKMTRSIEKSTNTTIHNLLKKGNILPTDIYNLIENHFSQDIRIVLCFDEFEATAQNPNFDPYFFSLLRSLVTYNFNVSLIVASQENLRKLTYLKEILTSPFFNIFLEMRIGFLKKEETMHLIHTPAEREGVQLNEDDVNFVFDVADCHPFFVQAACYEIFNYRYRKRKTLGEKLSQIEYRKLEILLYEKFSNHFEDYWSDLGDQERKKLKNICKSSVNSTKYDKSTQILEDLCLIKKEDDMYKIFSSLFQRFCREKHHYKEIF